jgi:MerR family mercuric resistance operon transcriptional regulator
MVRTISKLAKELGINIETIRFYERKGLIDQPSKPSTGYRHYSDQIVSRIRFIKRAQELGFTLEEVANLLVLSDQPCHRVQELAQNKLTSVQAKIKDLRRLETALDSLLDECRANDDSNHCPVIDSLQR